jgi:hypothetical protein
VSPCCAASASRWWRSRASSSSSACSTAPTTAHARAFADLADRPRGPRSWRSGGRRPPPARGRSRARRARRDEEYLRHAVAD